MRSLTTALLAPCVATAFFVQPPTAALSRSRRSMTMQQQAALDDFEATGISAPLGFFDPLGFSANKSPAELKRIRESELKHGRVAMLAALGYIVQEAFHPLFGFGDQDMGGAIYHFQEIQAKAPSFWTALVFAVALVEGNTITRGWQAPEDVAPGAIAGLREDYITGDLGFDPLGLKEQGAEAFNEMRTKELNNGRLAMLSVLAMTLQELISHLPLSQQLTH